MLLLIKSNNNVIWYSTFVRSDNSDQKWILGLLTVHIQFDYIRTVLLGFKDRPNIRFRSELSDLTNVDYQITFLSLYFKSHGFLFKILIQMCPSSTDGAIWIWVLWQGKKLSDVIGQSTVRCLVLGHSRSVGPLFFLNFCWTLFTWASSDAISVSSLTCLMNGFSWHF